MKIGTIRNRMLLAAVLPVTLVAALLAGVFGVTWLTDVNEAHEARTRFLARQVASASEYGLFSGNAAYLQTVANTAMRETDVHTLAIVDIEGYILASAGSPRYKQKLPLSMKEAEYFDSTTGLDMLMQPIFSTQLKLDDLYESDASRVAGTPTLLGYVVIEISHEPLIRRQHQMLWVGAAVTLGGLLFGGLLAWFLGRGVVRPILRVSGMVERIGKGDLSARVEVLPNDPLHNLPRVLNQMAQSLQQGRDELEQRVLTATQALRAKKDEAETATLAKSRFLASASHDLRQPTHALGMFVARLAQLPHDAETRNLIGNVEASLRALQDLLNGLLDISRLDANAVPVQIRAFPVAEIFDQLRSGLSLTASDKGLRLRVRPTDAWVLSDPALFHRILLNLVGNALRYTLEGSVLVVCRVMADDQHVRIQVWDSGIGIAPEHHQAIFKEFFQVGNMERDRSKGLGLGLNIVERTAQLLGCRLQLRSTLGRGTRFSIDVPLAPPGSAALVSTPPEYPLQDELAGVVVLVIEDDALARAGMVSLLESWGVDVREAENMSSALWHLKQGVVPAVIVSDYRLREDENGLEVIRQLRAAAGYATPACLISGDTDPALMQSARQAGLALLHKPVRPAKLRSLIRRLAVAAQDESDILM